MAYCLISKSKITEKEDVGIFQMVQSDKVKMTNTLMYHRVWQLAMPALEYREMLKQFLITSKSDWIAIIVQNLLDGEQLKFKPLQSDGTYYDGTYEEWRDTASDLILELILHHGIQYRALLLPLLDKKETREDFFALERACSAYGDNDVLHLVTHFADEPQSLSFDELELYADLLVTQNREKAIILLEKLRRDVPDFQLSDGGVWKSKTYHELLEHHIKQLKFKQ